MKRIAIIIVVLCSIAVGVQAQQGGTPDVPKVNVPASGSVKIGQLEQAILASEGPLIVNFWATFCQPCVKEMPYMVTITDSVAKKQPVKLLFVSLDLPEAYPAKVNAFLKKAKIKNANYWLNETNADIFCPTIDASWSGSIPATLFINPKTGYRKFYEQQLEPNAFRAAVAEMLNSKLVK